MSKTQHFAKSKIPQEIVHSPKWTNLMFAIKGVPRRRFYCKQTGELNSRLYLPVKVTIKGDTLGQSLIRVRLVRAPFKGKPVDPTAYDERILLPGDDGHARLSFNYRGKSEKGRVYYWQAQVHGPAEAWATGTHYADFWTETT